MRLITETGRHIGKPILGKFLFVYLVYYFYSQIGIFFFGGHLTFQAFNDRGGVNEFYYLLNFNDFPSSLVTLFQQMVVNNWFVTVDMYVNIMEDY